MKKNNSILLILIFSITTLTAQVNLKNGLVACYPFNANAKDETGNGNNGTVNGATLTTDRFGKVNSAYNFDGASYISAPPEQFKNDVYSFSLWVKLENLPSDGDQSCFISVGAPGGDHVVSVASSYSSLFTRGFSVGSYNIGTPAGSSNWTGVSATLSKWYHLVYTRDKTSIKLFVDGILISDLGPNTLTRGTSSSYLTPTNFIIGSRVGLNGLFQYTSGVIDDIHIYKRVLNADEVKALYDGNPTQSITISTNNPSPCGGDKITFTANGATNTSKYQWKVNGSNQGANNKSFVYNSANKSVDYQVKVAVEITDDDVCFPQKPVSVDKTIAIKFCSTPTPNPSNNILIPNAFSPNGDGTNDTWEVFSIIGNSDVIVEIYNRWGELIFYSKGYSDPWNGTYKDKPVMEGTYAYVVRVSDETVLRGTILVVR